MNTDLSSAEPVLRRIAFAGGLTLESGMYCNNRVSSTKYSRWNFLPKNLFEQMQRVSNIWFLLVSVFQLIPFNFNPIDSWSTIVPLSILLLITACKDAFNNLRRHQQDQDFNDVKHLAWNGEQFKAVKSQDLHVGSITRIFQGEIIPADLLLIAAGGQSNKCFASEACVNGLIDYQAKFPLEETQRFFGASDCSEQLLKQFYGRISVEMPNADLIQTNGFFELRGYPRVMSFDSKNMLLKGSSVHGVTWILGIVVYAGNDTKTQMNYFKAARKISQLESEVNLWVVYILVVLIGLVLFSVLGSYCFSISDHQDLGAAELTIVLTLLYHNIVPISLFVVMDLVRFVQMYIVHRQLNGRIRFMTGDVNEDLGQVEYILSDKTGTITENRVQVEVCEIEGLTFLRDEVSTVDESRLLLDNEESMLNHNCQAPCAPTLNFIDLRQRILAGGETRYYHFSRSLALCNNLFGGDESLNLVVGASFEDQAFVQLATDLGVSLLSKTDSECTLCCGKMRENHTILGLNPFSSTLRRSEILVHSQALNKYFIYITGALDVMEELLVASTNELWSLSQRVKEVSSSGKRVFVHAYKEVSAAEAQEMSEAIQTAQIAVVNKEMRITSIFQSHDDKLTFLGITGVEETVANRTKDTISHLKAAGIKLWLLSGDSEGNVLATATTAGILSKDLPVLNLTNLDNLLLCFQVLAAGLRTHVYRESIMPAQEERPGTAFRDRQESQHAQISLNKAAAMLTHHPLFKEEAEAESRLLRREFNPHAVAFALSLDRVSFRTALLDTHTKRMLVGLLLAADSVCCHNFMPQDKSAITQLLKESFKFKPVVLSIGDGNNDIPMLQAADVGVGVNSRWTFQAKLHSEIVVSHFADLRVLLLVYGRWNYSRMARLVLLFLYKNFVLTVALFIFNFVFDFTGQPIFNVSLLVGYNIFFTTLPVLAMGAQDQDLSPRAIRAHPEIYTDGIYHRYFSKRKLVKYSVLSITHGFILSELTLWSISGIISEDGKTGDLLIMGTTLFGMLVLTVLMQISIDTFKISSLSILSVVLSVAAYTFFLYLVSEVPAIERSMFGVAKSLTASNVIILVTFTGPWVCFMVSYAVLCSSRFYAGLLERVVVQDRLEWIASIPKRLETYATGLVHAIRRRVRADNNASKEAYDINPRTLRFLSAETETSYRNNYIAQNLRLYRFIFCFLFALLVIWTVFEALIFDPPVTFLILRVALCGAFFATTILVFTARYVQYFRFYNTLVLAIGLAARYALYMAFGKVGSLASAMISSVTYIFFSLEFVKVSACNLLSTMLFFVEVVCFTVTSDFSVYDSVIFILTNMTFNIAITLTSAYIGYVLEYSQRVEYTLVSQQKLSLERSASILGFLLPSFVRKRVKQGGRYIAEDTGLATVIFCDICDFDSICAEYSPLELTTFLDTLFQSFDRLCVTTGVSKIETVGKTYMACAGLKDFETDISTHLREIKQVRRAIEFATGVLVKVNGFKLKNGKPLQVKIGINSGPVTAGVVGYHKPQFALVGDTVNTASRMCSTISQPNTIQISEITYSLLDDRTGLAFTENTIEAKGKGQLKTYLVHEIASDAKLEMVHTTKNKFLNSVADNNSIIELEGRISLLKQKSIFIADLSFNSACVDSSVYVSKINFFSATCRETNVQRQFREEKMRKSFNVIKWNFTVALSSYAMIFFVSLLEAFRYESTWSMIIVGARSACVCVLLLERLLMRRIYLKRYFSWLLVGLLNILLYTPFLYMVDHSAQWDDVIALEILYIIMLLTYSTGASVSFIARSTLMIFIPWAAFSVASSYSTVQATNSIFIIGFVLIHGSVVYSREKQLRIYTDLKMIVDNEIASTNELLVQMMPPHVVANMKVGKSTTDKLFQVTLLYADIVGFTSWSSNKTPIEVVQMLGRLFTSFDKLCNAHNVYKVHTIGDCYVVMGYREMHNRNPAQECVNVVEMAYSMIEIIQSLNSAHGMELNMRIGIHTGEVIAGITGTNIVRYDIYGPDVLIANKMESGGQEGKVNISETTKRLLEDTHPGLFQFVFHNSIEVKTISRTYQTYFVYPGNR